MSDALLKAFRDLVLERGYERLTIRSLTARARVARSTFYEHFDSKTDILRQSTRPLFHILADAVIAPKCPDRLVMVLEHFSDNAATFESMLTGEPRDEIVEILAAEIEAVLLLQPVRKNEDGHRLPVRLAAMHLAGAQWALIAGWIRTQPACNAETIAAALFGTSSMMGRTLFEFSR